MRNSGYVTSYLIFWATFGGKMYVATTDQNDRPPTKTFVHQPKRSSTNQNVRPLGRPFGATTISNSFFRIFQVSCLISKLVFLGPFWRENWRCRHAEALASGTSKTKLNFGLLGGPVWSTVIVENVPLKFSGLNPTGS